MSMNEEALKAAGGMLLVILAFLNWFEPSIVGDTNPGTRAVTILTGIITLIIGLFIVVPAIDSRS